MGRAGSLQGSSSCRRQENPWAGVPGPGSAPLGLQFPNLGLGSDGGVNWEPLIGFHHRAAVRDDLNRPI